MKLKSNKQRRAEIKQQRIARAERLRAQLRAVPDARLHPVPGMVPADRELLARHNNTYGLLPEFYLDRAFTCRDCGAEEVWTARQQQWWYEVVHGAIDSRAVRCLACRRARRAEHDRAMAHEGANRLGVEAARLRALASAPPTADALAQIEAALQGKWWSLRVVAIRVMGHWGGAAQVERLQAWVAARPTGGKGWATWERVAADAARNALADCKVTA